HQGQARRAPVAAVPQVSRRTLDRGPRHRARDPRQRRLRTARQPVDLYPAGREAQAGKPRHRGAGADRSAVGRLPGRGRHRPLRRRLRALVSDAGAIDRQLDRLEAESLHVLREVAGQCRRPVMLYSIGKDSSVLLHLLLKAFAPAKPPIPLLHVDTTWKFREMIAFRDRRAAETGIDLRVHINMDGVREGIGPFTHGATVHTDVMKTQALKQALDAGAYDAAIGGARRDEEKSRAKERVFSFRNAQHRWDPKNQRPELWNLYNGRIAKGESVRVFPLSNWTELDVWLYIYRERIPVPSLYYAAERPV